MDEKERYPNFRALMNIIESHMTTDGVSIPVAEDLKEAKERLEETKRSLFQNEIILNELQDIVLEHHARKNRESVSVEELQVHEMLQEALRNADAKSYLRISWTEEDAKSGNIFGLTEEKLGHKESKKRNIQQILQQYFVPDVEQRLKERCIKLMKLWDSKAEGESDGLSLAKAAKLPLMVENEVKKISDMRKELKKEEGHYRKLVLNYQEELKEYMVNLEELVRKYPIDSQIDNTKTTAEWLEAKCEALQLKIRVLHCQLLKDTYTKETLAALRKIRELLERAMAESKIELAKLEQNLSIYESFGSGFDSLVKEYARLTAEIDNRKWALAELERTQKVEGFPRD